VTLCTVESGRVAVATTVYFVNGSALSGASQLTVADLIPAVTSVITGACGREESETGPNDADAGLVPTAEVAVTVNE
jgi:hypothetical protein